MAEETPKCIFCGIIDGSVGSAKIYEDELVICVLDIFPATKGHLLVIPKKHVSVSTQLDDTTTAHVFAFANKISSILFDAMGAQGTNIFLANGQVAGQKVDHAGVHVIPRYTDDGLKLEWETKQITEDELKDTFTKLSSKLQPTEEQPQAPVVQKTVEPEVVQETVEEEPVEEESDDDVLP